jgi:hypothetical protein
VDLSNQDQSIYAGNNSIADGSECSCAGDVVPSRRDISIGLTAGIGAAGMLHRATLHYASLRGAASSASSVSFFACEPSLIQSVNATSSFVTFKLPGVPPG